MKEELKKLSILIVTWNGDDLLKNCLDSVRRACGDVPEIVVVDNANLESTKALVATYPNAKYIAAPENLGFAGGNNLGLPLCTRPYVLLLNNDTIVHEEPFTQLIQYLKDHPKVAVVQGKMRLVRFGDVLDECGSYLTKGGILFFRYDRAPTSTPLESVPVFHAKGACLMFRRSIIDNLHGIFFHKHFSSYYEDVDFCHRVWLTGYEVHFINTPPIDHLCGITAQRITTIDIPTQALSNQLFSFLTLLEYGNRISIVTKLLFIHLLIALRYLAVLDFGPFKVFWIGILRTYRYRSMIRETRSAILKTRKIDDTQLFKHVLANVGLRFYWLWARGRLSEYRHEHFRHNPRGPALGHHGRG